MTIGFKSLTTAQIEAIRAALEKYEKDLEDSPISDADIDGWAQWATMQDLPSSLTQLGNLYKNSGDKADYLRGLDVLRIFFPEVDSPLFEVMREDEV